jgi:hypothetical protein
VAPDFGLQPIFVEFLLEFSEGFVTSEDKKGNGMPIYLDQTERRFASFDSEADSPIWYPANRAAHKLWRSVEALRDLKSILELMGSNPVESKRNLKIAATQLHTFAATVHDIGNYFAGDESLRNDLTREDVLTVKRVNKILGKNVPVRRNSNLDLIRNKLSAHIDAELYPSEARNLARILVPESFYLWLAYSIKGLIELLNLDVYHWTCESVFPDSISIMCTEPFVATLQLKPEPRLISVNITNGSPRSEIPSLCIEVLALAEWMRSPETPILKLVEKQKAT